SILATGFVRMWRAWRVIIPVVIINAVLQGLLLLPGVLPYLSLAFIVVALLSLVVLIGSFGLVAAAMLQAVEGAVSAATALTTVRARLLPLLGWGIALALVATLGFALYVLPGFIILALTPYLLLAVIDGRRNPVAVNVRTIGARWGRWLITVLIMGVLCFVLWFLAALDGFFVTGAPGAIIAWLALGLVSSWFTCAWALVYRSINPR
ncbi:MAG: hypothetical protein ACO3CU_05320, partial [Candidatus Nanopelagicales bacterium]